MAKIKSGDSVIVVAGKDKGRKGKVLKVLPQQDKVVVDGINVVKKHIKPRGDGRKGGIVDRTMPIHISNVMIQDPGTAKPTRVGMNTEGAKKTRVAKKSNKTI